MMQTVCAESGGRAANGCHRSLTLYNRRYAMSHLARVLNMPVAKAAALVMMLVWTISAGQ